MSKINPIDLSSVSKPLRYTGGEPGSVIKEPLDRLRFCLIFPDIYEIGMSHTGYRVLYTRLNESDSIYSERFFAPWPDAYDTFGSDIMVSLESGHPVKEFDVIGFSVQYEMCYPTLIRLIKMAGIPVTSKDRGDEHPVVIAGGSCILNPAPLKAFVDVFFMGEMDVDLVPVMEHLHSLRKAGVPRAEQLEALDKYPFTYVPSINPDKHVTRNIHKDFSADNMRLAPLVPMMTVVQDRVAAEIARGCTNGCRFCQAGIIYRPSREKGVADLCNMVNTQISATGYLEASLLSLDSGDYSQIEPLIESLTGLLNPKKVSLSLPSLRAETVSPSLMEKVGEVRKAGFTIAPEAGSQRLRDIINKNLSEEDIINAAVYAKHAEYNGAKLYFMCGLPGETDEDILAIADLVHKIQDAVKGGRYFNITVSVSNFVPKPFTPFERVGQISFDEFRRRHTILKGAVRKSIKLRFHDTYTSVLEAALSRGDERWHNIFLKALEKGFYLDAWSEFFSRDKWKELFAECGFSLDEAAQKNYTDDEILPWGNINSGVSDKWLKKEMAKAMNGETTADCRKGVCTNCGVCDFKTIKNTNAPQSFTPQIREEAETPHYSRYEIVYRKFDAGALFSALDTSRIFTHMLLSQGIKIKFTEGFNPSPRIITQAALPVGVSGEEESALFEAEASTVSEDIVARLNIFAPAGIEVLSVKQVEWPKNLARYEMDFTFDKDSFNFLQNAIDSGKAHYEKTAKNGKPKTVSLEDYLIKVSPDSMALTVTVTELGGFHFPEFFRKAGYERSPVIVRTRLTPETV